MFGEDDLIEALSAASAGAAAHGADTEIHLHSPLHYRLACAVQSINVIGVESAANPSYLSLIDRKELEASDTFLRIGIARTDISQLATVLNEKYGTNVWKEPLKMAEILGMETPEIIARRLANAASIFGERIKYTGPDCGLGSWPSQELAFGLLRNTRAGIDRFIAAQG